MCRTENVGEKTAEVKTSGLRFDDNKKWVWWGLINVKTVKLTQHSKKIPQPASPNTSAVGSYQVMQFSAISHLSWYIVKSSN